MGLQHGIEVKGSDDKQEHAETIPELPDPAQPIGLISTASRSTTSPAEKLGVGILTARGTNAVVYPHAAAIPGSHTLIMTSSVANQEAVILEVSNMGSPAVGQIRLDGVPKLPLHEARIMVTMAIAMTGTLNVEAKVLPDGELVSTSIPMEVWTAKANCDDIDFDQKMVCQDGDVKKFQNQFNTAEACLAKCQGREDKPSRWCCVYNSNTKGCRFHTGDFTFLAPEENKGRWNAAHCER